MGPGFNSAWCRACDLCASWWTRFVAFQALLAGTVLGLSGWFGSIFLPHFHSEIRFVFNLFCLLIQDLFVDRGIYDILHCRFCSDAVDGGRVFNTVSGGASSIAVVWMGD